MLFKLEIKKKSELRINPYIHHSKVPSSEQIWEQLKTEHNNTIKSALFY